MKNTVKRDPFYRFAYDPAFVAAFIVMAVNDHYFRPLGVAPLLAGKISDFAVLVFLPAAGALLSVYLRYLYRLAKPTAAFTGLRRGDALFGIILCGAVFTLIKSSPWFNMQYIAFINGINILRPLFPRLTSTSDPTDLAALPSLIASYLVMRNYFTGRDRSTPPRES